MSTLKSLDVITWKAMRCAGSSDAVTRTAMQTGLSVCCYEAVAVSCMQVDEYQLELSELAAHVQALSTALIGWVGTQNRSSIAWQKHRDVQNMIYSRRRHCSLLIELAVCV